MITSRDLNDSASERIRLHLPRFERAAPPDPGAGDWAEWQALLASREHAAESGPHGAMTLAPDQGYGTVSASLVALSARPDRGATYNARGVKPARADTKPIWLFAPGAPGGVPFASVAL